MEPSLSYLTQPPTATSNPNHTKNNSLIHREEVAKVLTYLTPGEATGPDSISARLLKETTEITAGPLTIICNIYLHSHFARKIKSGYCVISENYRPQIISHIMKRKRRTTCCQKINTVSALTRAVKRNSSSGHLKDPPN